MRIESGKVIWSNMKWKLTILFILLLILGFLLTKKANREVLNSYITYSACSKPLDYKLGKVDPRFQLSNQNILADIQKATSIWSNSEGRVLFDYNPDASLTVNFVYNQKQLLSSQIQSQQTLVESTNQTLQKDTAAYKQAVSTYQTQLNSYNNQVSSWNSKGGAPLSVYYQLVNEKKQLNQQAAELNSQADGLNKLQTEYNSMVVTLNNYKNEMNNALNINPEDGLFDPNNETITIYLVADQNQLIHTLAHEFGHSLGMVHVSNPKSIMYPYLNENTIPTAEDIAQLNFVCRNQSVFEYYPSRFITWLSEWVHSSIG